uniref:Uncharacterized protein n=1 Tax=Palpitomonas bilix TaxID=652834 RepID=A0A7S3DFS3_9EUKA
MVASARRGVIGLDESDAKKALSLCLNAMKMVFHFYAGSTSTGHSAGNTQRNAYISGREDVSGMRMSYACFFNFARDIGLFPSYLSKVGLWVAFTTAMGKGEEEGLLVSSWSGSGVGASKCEAEGALHFEGFVRSLAAAAGLCFCRTSALPPSSFTPAWMRMLEVVMQGVRKRLFIDPRLSTSIQSLHTFKLTLAENGGGEGREEEEVGEVEEHSASKKSLYPSYRGDTDPASTHSPSRAGAEEVFAALAKRYS